MPEGVTILVVEDDENLQSLVKRALEREGYAVMQAFSSVEMTRELGIALPDLIVLDVSLPDIDGRDRLATLKLDPKTRHIPVIIWSGRDAGSDRRITLELGAEDYIEKGPPSALLRKIERIIFRLSEPKAPKP